ncbi:GNAT family N-acetyltransferase [Acuticoccus sp. M5D2P5]|uniref:GNAT family N-acetyltransferase n=1 Tax=Acuticoccus kalidii TaxID=2910977 RepID=UPI001F272605|nr:GNAT family N-acetyltransferase [Acuticoccus kalidii]MCF3935559.1 GNAT family N-acetyltransferase [Acuticoccus kalidii]
MNTAVTIRRLTPRDEEDWRQLWSGYLAFYETSLPPVIYATTFARLLGDDPMAPRAFVAEADDRLVGLVHYFFHPHCWRIEPVCYLQDLFADESVRGQGVGRALIETVYQAADEAGAPSVYWLTQEFNTNARQLYDRIGTVTPFIKYQRPH